MGNEFLALSIDIMSLNLFKLTGPVSVALGFEQECFLDPKRAILGVMLNFLSSLTASEICEWVR